MLNGSYPVVWVWFSSIRVQRLQVLLPIEEKERFCRDNLLPAKGPPRSQDEMKGIGTETGTLMPT